MVRRVGLDLVRGVFTSASERTYQGYFGHFVKYSVEMVNRPMLLVENPDLTVNVGQLLDYVPYACSVLSIQQTTIDGRFSAIKYIHRVSSSLELDTRNSFILNALKGVARGRAQVGTQQRVRRAIALSILRGG